MHSARRSEERQFISLYVFAIGRRFVLQKS